MTSKSTFKNRYNRLATKSYEYTPYCYLLRHKRTGLVYYGSKFSKDAHPDFFMMYYFTSSKIVKTYLEAEGIESFEWEIRRTFKTRQECIDWEHKVLRRMNVTNHRKFMNVDSNQRVHDNSNTTFITNLESGLCIRIKKDSHPPEGWTHGNINFTGDTRVRERRWFHDPITGESFHAKPEEVKPEWVAGRGKNYISNSETLKNKNLIWITDGVLSKYHSKDDPIPDGWVRGMGKTNNAKLIEFNKTLGGFVFVNNGVEMKRIHGITVLEQGYFYGVINCRGAIYQANKDVITITNGVVNSGLHKDFLNMIPAGYIIGNPSLFGRLKSSEFVMITNGTITMRHPVYCDIPENWIVTKKSPYSSIAYKNI